MATSLMTGMPADPGLRLAGGKGLQVIPPVSEALYCWMTGARKVVSNPSWIFDVAARYRTG